MTPCTFSRLPSRLIRQWRLSSNYMQQKNLMPSDANNSPLPQVLAQNGELFVPYMRTPKVTNIESIAT